MPLACDTLEPELFRRTDSHFHYIIQSSRSSCCARVGRHWIPHEGKFTGRFRCGG